MAAAGDLDTTFGGTGYITTAVGSNTYDYAHDVLVQNDHKVVIVGTSSNSRSLKVTTHVIRYLENGSRDGTFGSGGAVNVTIGNSSYLRYAALQADGKIVLAGAVEGQNWAGKEDFAIVRLNSNGTFDKSFGKAGVVSTHMGGDRERVEAIVVQPDGKILVGGWSQTGVSSSSQVFALARYNSNGSLDATFGAGGKVLTDLRSFGGDNVFGLAVQADGKIVASGYSYSSITQEFVVARYTPSGLLDVDPADGFGPVADTTTGTRAGFVVTEFIPYENVADDVALQPDGKIVAVGRVTNEGTGPDFGVVRYLADGTLDNTFNGNGIATIDFTDGTNFDADYGRSLVIQSDGKIIVAGDPAPLGFALARLDANGALDPTFGVGGRVVTSAGGLRDAFGIALQPWDGKVVVVGAAGSSKSTFAVARFLTEATPEQLAEAFFWLSEDDVTSSKRRR